MLLKNYRMPYLDKPQNHMIHACVGGDCFKLGVQILFNELDVGRDIKHII